MLTCWSRFLLFMFFPRVYSSRDDGHHGCMRTRSIQLHAGARCIKRYSGGQAVRPGSKSFCSLRLRLLSQIQNIQLAVNIHSDKTETHIILAN